MHGGGAAAVGWCGGGMSGNFKSGNFQFLTGHFYANDGLVTSLEFRSDSGVCLSFDVSDLDLALKLLNMSVKDCVDAVLSKNGDFFVDDGGHFVHCLTGATRIPSPVEDAIMLDASQAIPRDATKDNAWAGISGVDYYNALGFVDQLRLDYLAAHAVLSMVRAEKQGGLQHIDAAIDALHRLRQLRGGGVVA
jgi:hypothetical protein